MCLGHRRHEFSVRVRGGRGEPVQPRPRRVSRPTDFHFSAQALEGLAQLDHPCRDPDLQPRRVDAGDGVPLDQERGPRGAREERHGVQQLADLQEPLELRVQVGAFVFVDPNVLS